MATRSNILGGTDWTDGEILYAADLNTTIISALAERWPAYVKDFTAVLGSEPNQDIVGNFPVLSFSASATNSAVASFELPGRVYNNDITVTCVYAGDTTNVGDIVLEANITIKNDAGTLTSGSATTTDTIAAQGTVNVLKVQALTNIMISKSSLSSTETNYIGLTFSRKGADGSDTYTGKLLLLSIILSTT